MKKYTKSEIEGMIKSLEAKEKKARSKWGKAVLQDAQWLLKNVIEGYDEPYELSEKLVLNGASDWKQFSWDGSGLISNAEIAEHYSTPSELKNFLTKDGGIKRDTNTAGEHLLDIQARALRQAWWAIRDEMKGTTEFSMSLCEFEEKKGNFGISNNPNYFGDWYGEGQIDKEKILNNDGEGDVYLVKIWSGSGYALDVYLVRAIDFYEAIDIVFEWSRKNEKDMIFSREEVEKFAEDAWKDYGKGKGGEKEDFIEDYIDTEFIASSDYDLFARSENFFVDKVPQEGDNFSIHELSAQHDSRKSFYGKAQVDVDDKTGVQTLYSYGTKVAEFNPKTKKFTAYPEAKHSATTKRQVREFMKQNGVPASEFSIIDDTKDVLRATSKGGILMF